jgi:ABC-2 type transport system ATP-binding protein
MRIGMGLLAADAGHVSWDGAPITRATQQMFGYMPEERGLYPKQAIGDQLRFFGEIHGLSSKEAARRADRFLESFGLAGRKDELLESLSLGNQQRVQIITALIHGPTCLILDEPFSGLDPLAVDFMSTMLREKASEGVPVLFSSHQLELVERLCDELVMLVDGSVRVNNNTTVEPDRENATYRLEMEGDMSWLEANPGISITRQEPGCVEFRILIPGSEQMALSQAVDRGEVTAFSRVQTSLSELFMATNK